MRERVLLAVDEKLKEDPENSHLQMQAAMIPYARITTIDSFCLGIIRSTITVWISIPPSAWEMRENFFCSAVP